MPWRVRWVVVFALACGMMAVPEAEAQDGGFDLQTLRPAMGPDAILVTESAEVFEHFRPYGGVFFDYMNQPLMLRFEDDTRVPVVDHRLTGHFRAGVGLFDHLQLDIGVPLVLANDGRYGEADLGGTTLGTFELNLKGALLSSLDGPVGLGAMVSVFGGGNPEQFAGDSGLGFSFRFLADTWFSTPLGLTMVAANFGVRDRATQTFHDAELGMNLTYGVGAQTEVVDGFLMVGLELMGQTVLREPSRTTSPMEALGSVSFLAADGLEVKAGVGLGVVGGVGSPRARGLLGFTYSPVWDREPAVADDFCPPEPEGFTGPYDADGCAITPETFRGCGNLVADWEGAVDRWGCPVLDSDGDGVLDFDDQCPFEPAVFIEGAGADGCPDYDVDGDGIPNIEDHCPLEPGLRAYDGCPPPADEEQVVRRQDVIEIRERVHFETNRAIIKEESYGLLEEVALVLRNHPDILLVEVAGHTDVRGDADYNRMLSEERARAVREFLIDRGVRAARLSARGYGASELLSEEDSDEAHAQNRRVEFRILRQGEEEDHR